VQQKQRTPVKYARASHFTGQAKIIKNQSDQSNQCTLNPKPRRTRNHRQKGPQLGHQKQRLPGIGREVFGLGDAIANLQK
jgi:hypothetical protein